MHFSFALIRKSAVFQAYLILYFIQKCVLSCWEQWPCGPGYSHGWKPLCSSISRGRCSWCTGVCAEAEWDSSKSPCPLLFPHRADSGASKTQLGCSKTKPRICLFLLAAPWLSVGNLSSSQWLPFHCYLWAPCRSCYTNAKEALHPKSLEMLKTHICSPLATHTNGGLVSKFLNFCTAKLKEND